MELNLYTGCSIGVAPTTDIDCGTDICAGAECPSFSGSAVCRVVKCGGKCQREWFHNGISVTSDCASEFG